MSEPNKVPEPRSNAGPGCWECADCDLIVSSEDDECPRCSGEWGPDEDTTETATLGDF